jgi:hypothetical protein
MFKRPQGAMLQQHFHLLFLFSTAIIPGKRTKMQKENQQRSGCRPQGLATWSHSSVVMESMKPEIRAASSLFAFAFCLRLLA